jgi:hypothetical protein
MDRISGVNQIVIQTVRGKHLKPLSLHGDFHLDVGLVVHAFNPESEQSKEAILDQYGPDFLLKELDRIGTRSPLRGRPNACYVDSGKKMF